MHAHIGRPEAVLDVRTVRVSGWGGDVRLPMTTLDPDIGAAVHRDVGLGLLCLLPAPDRLGQSGNVVAQGDPDLFIIDAMVSVRRDDPHTLDFSPGNLRRCLDDLIWQLGGDVAQAANDGLTREAQQALGVPALLPEVHKFCCRIGGLSQIR